MENEIIVFNNPREWAMKIFDGLEVHENTRKEYRYRIGMFLDFVGEAGFNRNSFREFKRALADRRDYKISTKNKYLATARVFLREAHFLGKLSVDVTLNTNGFRIDKKHKVEGVNEDEMGILTARLQQLPDTAKNARLKAILSLLIFQGLRGIEVVRLDLLDVDFANQVALVQGKDRDDTEAVNLHPETIKALQGYIKSNKVGGGPLFVSYSNNSQGRRLTVWALGYIIKELFDTLGIKKTKHGLRHYFTTALIKTYKGELLEVAGYTRHRSIEMLQVYNDAVRRKEDLPRFYGAFEGVKL